MEEVSVVAYTEVGKGFVVEAQSGSRDLCFLTDARLTAQNKTDIADFLAFCLSKSEATELENVVYFRNDARVTIDYKSDFDSYQISLTAGSVTCNTSEDDKLTGLSALDYKSLYAGHEISGDGIQSGTTVISKDGAGSITLSLPTTATAEGVTLNYAPVASEKATCEKVGAICTGLING